MGRLRTLNIEESASETSVLGILRNRAYVAFRFFRGYVRSIVCADELGLCCLKTLNGLGNIYQVIGNTFGIG